MVHFHGGNSVSILDPLAIFLNNVQSRYFELFNFSTLVPIKITRAGVLGIVENSCNVHWMSAIPSSSCCSRQLKPTQTDTNPKVRQCTFPTFVNINLARQDLESMDWLRVPSDNLKNH
jgi:hypothetical protein